VRLVPKRREPQRADFDAYRQQLSRLLDLVDEQNLAPTDRDALATGIRLARKRGESLTLPRLQSQRPRAFELGERILHQLAEADAELRAEDVAELDALLVERLPETL
jgi:hypothetical protein